MATHDYPPRTGGISAHVYELSRAMAGLGHEVVVVTTSQPGAPREEDNGAVRVLRLPRRGKGAINALPYMFRAARAINSEEPDVVHYHNLLPEGIITKFVKARPRVFTAHESRFLMLARKRRNRPFLRWLLSHPDAVIAPSRELARQAVSFGCREENAHFIPNGVDASVFNPSASGEKVRRMYSAGAEVILVPRRLVEKNGVIYAVQAMPHILRKHPTAKMIITGDGPERRRIEREIGDLGISRSVVLAGDICHDLMPQYHAAADIAMLPSLMEATSIAGLEAMACGKPIIGTSVGGMRELISFETGEMVAPYDPKALAEAAVGLLSDDMARRRMGAAARKRACLFDWREIAGRTALVYARRVRA